MPVLATPLPGEIRIGYPVAALAVFRVATTEEIKFGLTVAAMAAHPSARRRVSRPGGPELPAVPYSAVCRAAGTRTDRAAPRIAAAWAMRIEVPSMPGHPLDHMRPLALQRTEHAQGSLQSDLLVAIDPLFAAAMGADPIAIPTDEWRRIDRYGALALRLRLGAMVHRDRSIRWKLGREDVAGLLGQQYAEGLAFSQVVQRHLLPGLEQLKSISTTLWIDWKVAKARGRIDHVLIDAEAFTVR